MKHYLGEWEGKLAFSRDVGSALKTWRIDLVYATSSLVVSTRLAVHKQSFLNLLRQNDRRVTKVYALKKNVCRLTYFRGDQVY